MTLSNSLILTTVGVVMMTSQWVPVSSHGRLWEPPARGTMWRRSYSTPTNYDDAQMYCGGFQHQVNLGYKCGVCGDAFDLQTPRPHEAGGLYATGIVTANYIQGQQVTLQVEITANHKGWFEFKICPTNNYTETATQECFDQYVLQLADGSGTKLNVTRNGNSMVEIPVVLPENLVCDFCTIQWRYHTGNSWGVDPDGRACVGCGFQEEFYGCADVKITASDAQGTTRSPSSTTPPEATSTTRPEDTTTTITTNTHAPEDTTTRAPPMTTSTTGNPTTSSRSSAVIPTESSTPPESLLPHIFSCTGNPSTPGMVTWCNDNCNHLPSFCPRLMCRCSWIVEPRFGGVSAPGCYATSPFYAMAQSADDWCRANCALGNCPANWCFCKM